MGLFGSEKPIEIDPYKYWLKHFGGDYGVAKDALTRAMRIATDEPEKSPAFQMGKQVLDEQTRSQRQQMMSALTQRGTAFGGQARRASADIGGMNARALLELIRKIQALGPEHASRLGALIPGVQPPQLVQPESSMGDSLLGKILGQVAPDLIGGGLTAISPFLGMIPGIGPFLAAGTGIAGGALTK